MRGDAHISPRDLRYSAKFRASREHKQSYGPGGNFTWTSSGSKAGFRGKIKQGDKGIWYPDSGFVETISRSMLLAPEKAQEHVQALLADGWTDRRTRAIFVEFGLSSLDSRQMFPHVVRVAAEFSPMVETRTSVETTFISLDNSLEGEFGQRALWTMYAWVIFYVSVLGIQV